MKPGALLLLLAVAASQVDLYLSETITGTNGVVNVTSCPVNFYRHDFTFVDVTFNPDSSVSICLKNDQIETAQECMVIEDVGGSDSVDVSPGNEVSDIYFGVLPPCSVKFDFKRGANSRVEFYFYRYTSGGAVEILMNYNAPSINLTATVGNSTLRSLVFADNIFFRVAGCRFSGVPFLPDSDVEMKPETCSKVICDDYDEILKNVSTCDPMEVCLGNNTCVIPPVVCTVTGSSVIDFYGGVHSVQDRCAYSLMRPEGSSDFDLVAGFRERRRKDVSFLDYLIISLPGSGVKMHLEQGGRVRVGNNVLTLSATPQLFHDVELSKDDTGVTAKIPFSNMTLLFDGNTAHVSGLEEPVEGLCGSYSYGSSTPSGEIKRPYSAVGCEIQHNDTVDTTINCNRSTEHCNVMRQAPFTACHDFVDPEPYITACTDTLCNYPPVDGLKCQVLEAYVKACSLRLGVIQEDWRSTADCPADPLPPCLDQYCSDHEFCGEKVDGIRCFCRALFASKYKSASALGEPTVCMQNSAAVTLAGCLLEDKGIDYSNLHLNDPNCKGDFNNQTHMVTFSYDSSDTCGAEVMMNNSQLFFKNTIVMRNRSLDIITRQDQVVIDFSCFYTQPDIRSVSFTIKDSSVVQQIVSAVWNYTLMMNAYTDSAKQQPVRPSTEIQLNQKLWLELKTEGLDSNMVTLVTDSCWATNQPSPDGSLRYNLIMNGCPNPDDQTVIMEGNGEGTSSVFSFNMFQFSGHDTEVYLHCQLDLCPVQSQSCAPSCGGGRRRRRRSSRSNYADGNPALITMAWSN